MIPKLWLAIGLLSIAICGCGSAPATAVGTVDPTAAARLRLSGTWAFFLERPGKPPAETRQIEFGPDVIRMREVAIGSLDEPTGPVFTPTSIGTYQIMRADAAGCMVLAFDAAYAWNITFVGTDGLQIADTVYRRSSLPTLPLPGQTAPEAQPSERTPTGAKPATIRPDGR